MREYVPAVAYGTVYALVAGGIGQFVGWAFDLNLIDEMPGWGWTVLIALAFATAQFQAFHKVRIQRDAYAPKKAEADLYISDAHNHIIKRRPDLNSVEVLREVRQAATNGNVWIWGRHYTGGLQFDSDKPLVRIKAEYWQDHRIRETIALSPRDEVAGTNQTEDEYSNRAATLYSDLHLNRDQVRLRWP